jgi:sec-independent protein translocase protein TatB
MFEVGFSELLVIFVLALIVLGPEKLPRLAAQVGRWIGRARAMAKQFRDQLEEEVNVAEASKWKPTPEPTSTTSAEPPPAEPDASTPSESAAGTAPSDMQEPAPADPHAAHEAHPDLHGGAHHSGPPPEPEASLYEPPAYSSGTPSSPGPSPATASPAPAPAPAPNGAQTAAPPAPSHPPATSDDPPLRPGDVVTTTHERGI